MVPYYGDFAEDDTVNIPFNTFTSDDPSASVTITNLADADIKVHKDGSTDEIATDGATVAINFDGVTGNHLITIDTSVDAAYATGSEYQVRIEGTTVDGATINAWVGAFSIERAGGTIALLKLIQAAVITNAAGADIAADIIAVKAETAAIVDDTDLIDHGTSGLAKIASDVADILTDTGSTLDTLIKDIPTVAEFEARSDVAGTAATPAEIATALTDIHLDHLFNATYDPANKPGAADALLNEIIENDGGVSRFTENALEEAPSGTGGDATEAKQDSIIAAVITNAAGVDIAADIIAVKAETALIVEDTGELQGNQGAWATATGFSTHDAAAVKTALEADGSKLDHLWEMTEDDEGTRRLTENALEEAPSGGLNAQEIRDSMKLAPSGNSPAAGSIDKHLDDIEGDTNELQTDDIPGTLSTNDTSLDTQLAAIKAETALIVADTNELQTDDYPTSIAAIKAETALIVADTNELQTDNIPGTLTTIASYIDTEIAAIKTVVDAIQAVTDLLPDGGALNDLAAILTDTGTTLENRLIAIEADTDVIDDGTSGLVKIAQDVAAILVDTGTTLENRLIAIEADTDVIDDGTSGLVKIAQDVAATLVDTGTTLDGKINTIDTVVDAIKVITDALTAASAAKLALSAGTIVAGTVSHDNTAASTTVFYSDDIVEGTADHFNGRLIGFTSGALQYQYTSISDYELVSGEGKFTVVALTEAPADNVTFIIV